jgi:hypothetical protein
VMKKVLKVSKDDSSNESTDINKSIIKINDFL